MVDVVVVDVVVVDVVVVDVDVVDELVDTAGGLVVVVLDVEVTRGVVVVTTTEGGAVGVTGTCETADVGGAIVLIGTPPANVVVVVVERPRVGRVVTGVSSCASGSSTGLTGLAVAEMMGGAVLGAGAVESGVLPPSARLPPRRSFQDARLLDGDDVGDGSAEAAGRPGDAMVTRSERSRTNALAKSVPTTTTVAMITTVAVRCMAWPRGRR